jgi:transposase
MHFKVERIKGHSYLYLVENAWVDGKHKRVMHQYVGSPKQVKQLLDGAQNLKIKTYSFGRPAAILHAAERLNFISIIDRNIQKKDVEGLSVGQYALLLITARTEGTLSRNRVERWFKGSILQHVFHPEHSLSCKNLINQMNYLDERAIEAIERDLAARLIELGITPSKLIFDTTNRYSYIEHGGELFKKGNSKQKQFSKNIVGVALTVNEDNLPFMSEVYPGNEHDSTVFQRVFKAMCRRLDELKVDAEDLVMVFDKGINSKDNVDMVLGKMHVVGSLARDEAKDLLEEATRHRFEHAYTNADGHRISAWRTRGPFYGREFEVVVQNNPATAKRQAETYARQRAAILEGVEVLKASCFREGPGRRPSEKGIINKLGDLVHKDLRGVFDYGIKWTEEGRPYPWLEVVDKAEEAYRRSLGMTVVFTDLEGRSAEEILRTYNSRALIEEDFKWMEDKVVIPLWPFYVRKDLTVRAHVFLVLLGLMLYRLVQRDLGKDSMYLSTLVSYLDEIRVALVSAGRRRPRYVMEEMDAEAARLFSKLDMARFIPR